MHTLNHIVDLLNVLNIGFWDHWGNQFIIGLGLLIIGVPAAMEYVPYFWYELNLKTKVRTLGLLLIAAPVAVYASHYQAHTPVHVTLHGVTVSTPISPDLEDRTHGFSHATDSDSVSISDSLHVFGVKARLFGLAITGHNTDAIQDKELAAQQAADLAAAHVMYRPGKDASSQF